MPTEADLAASLLELQQRFSWQARASSYTLDGSWKSRTATLYRLTGQPAGQPRVVVKVFDDPRAYDAAALDAAARSLAGGFEGQDDCQVRIPQALGWASLPTAVYSEYIDGIEVIRMFADLDHPMWPTSGFAPVRLVAECGRALGVYHRIGQPDPASAQPLSDFEHAARSMRLPERVRMALLDSLTRVPTFGDYGPHQLMVTAEGGLMLLDAPAHATMGAPHGDIARFLFGLGKALARNPGGAANQHDALRDAFIDGYAEAGPDDPRASEGRKLIAVFEGAIARGVARQRWSIGRRTEALRYGRRWLAGVRTLRR